MPFLSLTLYNFRNLANETIDLFAKEVFFVGENGQGKSNLLEALYYSAYASSFRTRIEHEVVKNGENEMSLNALFKSNISTDSVSVKYENGRKRIEKNRKRVNDRKDLINTIPCVLFSHGDIEFASGEPERRRFFIDQSLSMYDIVHLEALRRYRYVLKSRNTCIRERNLEMLSSYDTQLSHYGLEVEKKRRDAIFRFNQIFGKLFEQISGIEDLVISYEPAWKKKTETGFDFPNEEEIISHLESRRDIDLKVGTTLSGPHRDRIRFLKNGIPFIPQASTGQRRLVSLILRVAQGVFYTQITGKKPVFLMDDVMLELDPLKREKFTSLLPEYDQLFCTFLPGEPFEKYIRSSTKVYQIEKGFWKEKS
jgi:DNA replication and repair protein RecF